MCHAIVDTYNMFCYFETFNPHVVTNCVSPSFDIRDGAASPYSCLSTAVCHRLICFVGSLSDGPRPCLKSLSPSFVRQLDKTNRMCQALMYE